MEREKIEEIKEKIYQGVSLSTFKTEELNEEICIFAVKEDYYNFFDIPDELKTKEVCLEAIYSIGNDYYSEIISYFNDDADFGLIAENMIKHTFDLESFIYDITEEDIFYVCKYSYEMEEINEKDLEVLMYSGAIDADEYDTIIFGCED